MKGGKGLLGIALSIGIESSHRALYVVLITREGLPPEALNFGTHMANQYFGFHATNASFLGHDHDARGLADGGIIDPISQ